MSPDDSVIFTVTFKYVDTKNIDVNNLLSVLNFEFEEYIRTVITYDYNYLPNNLFEDYYDTSTFKSCCGASDYFYYTARTQEREGIMYEATMYPRSKFTGEWIRGYFFINKTATPLVDGQTYTLIFETKGSGHFSTAMIGVEQDIDRIYKIPTAWTRHTLTFQAYTKDTSLAAFIVYDWGSDTVYPTIKLRNVQLQSGGQELYTKSDILRANRIIGDNLKTPTRTGWTFLGWFTDPMEGTQITNDTLVPETETTYYAHWSYNI